MRQESNGADVQQRRSVRGRVITSAVSLGHDETLIAYEQYPDGPAAAFHNTFQQHGLIRLAIGLGSKDDIIADLDAALTTVYGPPADLPGVIRCTYPGSTPSTTRPTSMPSSMPSVQSS